MFAGDGSSLQIPSGKKEGVLLVHYSVQERLHQTGALHLSLPPDPTRSNNSTDVERFLCVSLPR